MAKTRPRVTSWQPPPTLVIAEQAWVVEGDSGALSDDLYGICQRDQNAIYLTNRMHPDQKLEAFVHELLHAVWGYTSLPEKFSEAEEEIIRALSPHLAAVLRRNKMRFW